jgi:hypothetical protein
LSDIPGWLREIILARDGGQCRYCRMQQFGQGSPFHIDHVWPRSRGGSTQEDNLALQCPHCSVHKAAKVSGTDSVTGQSVSLFHPLRQQWSDHFELRPDGRCIGRDPIGRATVESLAMNRPFPLDARATQIALGRLLPTPS